jgi:exosortase
MTPTSSLPLQHDSQRDPRRDAGWLGFPWSAWLLAGLVGILWIAIYRYNLVRLWVKTNPYDGEENWGHAIAVPIIGLIYLYQHRDELLRLPVKPLLGLDFTRQRVVSSLLTVLIGLVGWLALSNSDAAIVSYFSKLMLATALLGGLVLAVDWGLGTLIGGLLLSTYGIYPGQNDFIWDVGMVVTLFGAVLTLCGWQIMRIAWFPIVFLLAALPWPPLLYSSLALPLQQLAAQAAVFTLQITGVESSYAGTKIFMKIPGPTGDEWRTLNVAEACAGLRSLMTFVSLGAAVAFLSNRPLWQKLVITLSAIPIAIFCNVLRVSGQGLLDRYVSQELSQDFAHQFVGLVMLIPAFFMVMGVVWVLDQLFIDEDDATPHPSVPGETAA